MLPLAPFLPFGTCASIKVTILAKPAVNDFVTIAGVSYSFGGAFFGNNAVEVAGSLTAAINADVNRQSLHGKSDPFNKVFAVQYGTTIAIFSAIPGPYGNTLTASSSSSLPKSPFVVSGGGNFSGAIGDGSLGAASGVKTSQTTLAANSKRRNFMVQNCNTAVLYMKLGAGASASDFTRVLAACTAADDDKGGAYPWDYEYKGQVTFFSASTYRYAVTELVLP